MYMKPTLLTGGSLWPIQAPAQSMAFLSPHIGSGLAGSAWPGMQVHCPVPGRNVRILPSAPIAMTVASLLMFLGAADSDNFMMSASLMVCPIDPSARPYTGASASANTVAQETNFIVSLRGILLPAPRLHR